MCVRKSEYVCKYVNTYMCIPMCVRIGAFTCVSTQVYCMCTQAYNVFAGVLYMCEWMYIHVCGPTVMYKCMWTHMCVEAYVYTPVHTSCTHLHNILYTHIYVFMAISSYYTAVAPEMISQSSVVIFVCRTLLYCKVSLSSISPAFLDALPIAAIRADCSEAIPSSIPANIEFA